MKVVRLSDKRFHEQAREQHEQVLAHHRDHVAAVRAQNREARELRERVVQRAEDAQRRYEKLNALARKFAPKPSPADVPEVVEIAEPDEPTFPHELTTFTARDVKFPKDGEPWEMVETPWGLARAHAGSKVLRHDVTGEQHIETAETFDREYEKA